MVVQGEDDGDEEDTDTDKDDGDCDGDDHGGEYHTIHLGWHGDYGGSNLS